MLLLCLRSKHRRNALETPEITQNPPSVLWKTFGEGSAQREIKLLTTTERGKELLRVFVAESCFYFKYCFVNMFVLLLYSEVLAQRKIPACWVLTKGHPCPPLDNIISWQASLGRHGWGGRQIAETAGALFHVKVSAAMQQKVTWRGEWSRHRMEKLKRVFVEIIMCQST